MIVRSLFATAAALSLTLATANADAADGPWLPRAQGSRIGVEMDWWPTDSNHVVAFGIVGQIQLARVVYLDFDVPFAIWDRDYRFNGSEGTFVFGNPTVGAHWADTINSKVSAFAGGTFTIPTMVTDRVGILDNDRVELANGRLLGTYTRAWADVHRFVPEYVFVRGNGGMEIRILPVLYYRFAVAPVIAIPVSEIVDDPEFIIEIHNEIEARGSHGAGGGLRLQGVFNPTDVYGDDAVQTAIEPYFVYEPIRGFYARVGSLVALDRSLGFGLNDGKVATFRVHMGGKW